MANYHPSNPDRHPARLWISSYEVRSAACDRPSRRGAWLGVDWTKARGEGAANRSRTLVIGL